MELPTWIELQSFIIDQIKNNDFFAAAGFFSALGLIWNYTKEYPEYIWNRIKRKIYYSVTIYETNLLYDYINTWMYYNHNKTYRNVEARCFSLHDGVRYYQFEDLIFMRRKMNWLRIWKGREKLENASSMQNAYLNHFKLSGYFAKNMIEKLFKEVIAFNEELEKQSQVFVPNVYFNDGSGWYDFGTKTPKSLEKIVLKDKDKLDKDISNFLNNKEWYSKRGVLYKRGYLLYGPAGNGKSSLVMALALKHKRHTYFLNPKRLDDGDLIYLFSNLKENSILVIEDVDAFFGEDRATEDKDIRFSFSTLLNCLDGAFSKEGIITIFTTNYPEKLDSALIRSGRMDFHLEIKNPDRFDIIEYLNIFFERSDASIDVDIFNEISMAKVQDICLSNRDSYDNAKKEIEKHLIE